MEGIEGGEVGAGPGATTDHAQDMYEMEAPQNGAETAVVDLYRDAEEQPLTENNDCSEAENEMNKSEFETGVGNLDRDEQEQLLAENNNGSEVSLNRDDQEQLYETGTPQTEVETVIDDI
ncbi:hypothetical protein ACJX0J_027902, partial [Zea mays]